MKEKLFFENSSRDRLCGILSNPTDDMEGPVIVMCHGFSSGKDSSTYTRLEEILNGEGISTFRFDFYGHGESAGKFKDITVSEAVDDALSAIDFLKGRGYSKIGLFGSSFGGIASILAASRTDDIYILALKSPVSDYREAILLSKGEEEIDEWEEEGFTVYSSGKEDKKLCYSFFEDLKDVDGYEAARDIDVHTLIVHGSEDETVPPEQSIKTAEIIENCKLDMIQGADHRYTREEDFEILLEKISEFIVRNS